MNTCTWTRSDWGWNTTCGRRAGAKDISRVGLEQGVFKFCPYCGAELVVGEDTRPVEMLGEGEI